MRQGVDKLTILAQRTFSLEDQQRFAAASGDYNPMHLDALKARRTQAGAPVVHGIHLLLWALDAFAASRPAVATFQGLRAQFSKFVYLDERAELQIVQQRADRVRLAIVVGGIACSKITLKVGEEPPDICPVWADSSLGIIQSTREPLSPDFNQFAGYAGRLTFSMKESDSEALFPAASKWLRSECVAALASSTHLVGMICPGLHSIYDEIAVRACTQQGLSDALSFRVTHADPRVRSVELEISGGGLSGTVLSFARTPPVEQASMDVLRGRVGAFEFEGSLSLIVGGSRGLGELTAKLIASGGGRVLITWHQGREDAEKVRNAIRADGGSCELLRYDAGNPPREQLAGLVELPTHAYYFPTPAIFRSQSEIFSAERFQQFFNIYVDGFWRLIEVLQERCGALSVFYPSSVSVVERPRGMTEYAMAKAAGEVLCSDINASMTSVRIMVSRLPRLQTDQTASVARADTADPVETLIPMIRAVQASHPQRSSI